MPNETSGSALNGANGVGYDLEDACSGEGSSTRLFTPDESPPDEERSTGPRSGINSLSTANALGSVPVLEEETLDMICIGFGPASLAIAIALADAYSKSPRSLPKVLFIEKQEEFAWHSGMQIPSAKMQISFLKDLATPRDPTSPYTFINYLHSKGRLNQFINLGTFLPTRLEYEDYMRWCAGYFAGVVRYGREVEAVEPFARSDMMEKAHAFQVKWRGINGLDSGWLKTRHVVVAAGGEPHVPMEFKPFAALPWERVSHSSRYAKSVRVLENLYRETTFLRRELEAKEDKPAKTFEKEKQLSQKQVFKIEPIAMTSAKQMYTQQREQGERVADMERKVSEAGAQDYYFNSSLRAAGLKTGRPRFAVVGNGQSAAEIFSDLWTRFPDADVCLIIKGTALRPSDDSPFVNEVFDPERVDNLYFQSPEDRKQAIEQDKGTNYGVVRLELLEHIYERIYMQRIQDPDPSRWRCKIIPNRRIMSVKTSEDKTSLILQLSTNSAGEDEIEQLPCSHVFVATGYTRNAHRGILKGTRVLLPDDHKGDEFPVGRDYRVEYDRERVEDTAGVWLQGCNESTHGLSDTLLSILAVRGGEIVQSIFGEELAK